MAQRSLRRRAAGCAQQGAEHRQERRAISTCVLRYPEKIPPARQRVRARPRGVLRARRRHQDQRHRVRQALPTRSFPAGHVRRDVSSRDGAVLLTTFAAQPTVEQGEPEKGLYDKKLLIEQINTLEIPWDPGLVDPQLAGRRRDQAAPHRPIHGRDPPFIYSSAAHRVPPQGKKPRWTHSMVEEIFVLDGEYVFADAGVMGPGGYVWWREHSSTRGRPGRYPGFNLWVRTVNGPMHNIFEKKKHPMDWNPKVPAETAGRAQAAMPSPMSRQRKY